MKMLASIMLLGFACLFLKIESVTSAPMADADPQNVFIFPGGSGQGFQQSGFQPGGGYPRHGSWGFSGTHLQGRRGFGK